MNEMFKNGFIKLHRSLLDWEWYSDIPTKTLFIHLILTVNINDSRWQGIEIQRGSRVSSLDVLSNETGLTIRQLRTAIKHLETTGELTRYKYPKFTVFYVNNFDKFQEMTIERQTYDNLSTIDRQQNKNTKKLKEEKEDVPPLTESEIEQIFQLFSSICKSYEPPIQTNIIVNRIKKLLQRYSIEQFAKVFENAESSTYLKGINEFGWKADFEWILKDDKFEKILTGAYGDWKINKSNNKTQNLTPENNENAVSDTQIAELIATSTISNVN